MNLNNTGATRLSEAPRRYEARPDGRLTLTQLIAAIPADQRRQIEDDLHALMAEGWGELSLSVVNGAVAGHCVTISRRYHKWKNPTG